MKILIFGKNGQVATELQRALAQFPIKKFVSSIEANFLQPESVIKVIKDFQPTHIINAAAYTAVDKAETESDLAFTINAETVGAVAEQAKYSKAVLIHYSTDYVFNGKEERAYTEEDKTDPINVYGKSKLLGEENIRQSGADFIILRVSWIYGNHGQNFYKSMLRLGKEKEELKIVSDQIGAPTWSRNIANATSTVLCDKGLREKSGIYHFADVGEVSWFEFARKIFDIQKIKHPETYKNLKRILPINTSEYKSAAKRPLNSRLNTLKIKDTFGINFKNLDGSLREILEER